MEFSSGSRRRAGGGGGREEFPGGQMVKVVAPALLIEREMPEADWGGISPHYLQMTTTYLPRMVYKQHC